jgi:hypothetical protein
MSSFLNSSSNNSEYCIENSYNPRYCSTSNFVYLLTTVKMAIKFVILLSICSTIYTFWTNYIISLRERQWENACEKTIVDKFLDILYLSDYDTWHFTTMKIDGTKKKNNIRYADIRNAFEELDPYSKMRFSKKSTILGLSKILKDILQE